MNKYQEALDKLTLLAKTNKDPTSERVKECNRLNNKLQKLIDRQKKTSVINIHIKDNEDYTYCSRCSTKLIKRYKYCYKCGGEIDWR